MTQAAKEEGVAVRGYVSCVVGCPYQVGGWAGGNMNRSPHHLHLQLPLHGCTNVPRTCQPARAAADVPPQVLRTLPAMAHDMQGEVTPEAAAHVAGALHDMGCYQVSMGDSIGVGTPASGECSRRQHALAGRHTYAAGVLQAGCSDRGPFEARHVTPAHLSSTQPVFQHDA